MVANSNNHSKSTDKIIPRRFVISAPEAKAMAEQRNLTLPNLLPSLVPMAQSLSRAPISNYPVGAVGLGISGRIYLGANLEFPGLPLHHSVHAEQFVITVAVSVAASDSISEQITHIAVSSFPCGHCRQFLQELRSASDIQIFVTSSSSLSFIPLSTLLPHPFGPTDLLHRDALLLLEQKDNNIIIQEEEERDGTVICKKSERVQYETEVKKAAERAARRAHAPYSGCPTGFAMGDEKGRIFSGSYAESAAYNPSLGPIQAAMIGFVGGGGGEYGSIVTAALVETKGSLVSQESTARILLEKVAPMCTLHVYHCTLKI